MILHDAIQAELLLNSTAMPELSSRAASIDDNEAFVQFPTPTSTTANFDLLLRYQHHKYPYFAGVFIDGHEVPQAQTIQYQPSTSPTYFQAKFNDSATLAETLTKNVVLKLWECQCDPKTGTVTLGATIARFEWIYATAAQLRQLELIPHLNQSPTTSATPKIKRQTPSEATHQTLRNSNALLLSLLTPAQHLEYLTKLISDSTPTTQSMYLRAFEPLKLKYQKKIQAGEAAEKALEFIASSPVVARQAMSTKDANKKVHFRTEEEEVRPIKKLSLILHPPSSPESTLSSLASSAQSTPRTSVPRSISLVSRSPLSPSAGSLSPPKRRGGSVSTSPEKRGGSTSPEKRRGGLTRRATPVVRLDEPKRMQIPSLKAQEMADQENLIEEDS